MYATNLVQVLKVLANLTNDVNHSFNIDPCNSIVRKEVAEVLLSSYRYRVIVIELSLLHYRYRVIVIELSLSCYRYRVIVIVSFSAAGIVITNGFGFTQRFAFSSTKLSKISKT